MAIRLYKGRIEFDYDSSDGSVKTTHTVYIESDGLYFDGTIYGTGSPGITTSSPVSSDSSGLLTGDFEIQPNQIAFGSNTLFAKADGSGVVFSGTIGATLDSVEGSFGFNTSPPAQGTVAAFYGGGYIGQYTDPTDPTTYFNTYYTEIDKFPFAISGGTATDVGDLSSDRISGCGNSSSTDGFMGGGANEDPGGNIVANSTIDKFPFAISSGTATDVGDIDVFSPIYTARLVSASTSEHGYIIGGTLPSPLQRDGNVYRFPFAISNGLAKKIGQLPYVGGAGDMPDACIGSLQSQYYGYAVDTNGSLRFPFAQDDVTLCEILNFTGLPSAHARSGGTSSETNGYISGGVNFVTFTDVILTFPFSSPTAATSPVGSLSAAGLPSANHSSTTHGFVQSSGIDKFPFSFPAGTAANVGSRNNTIAGQIGSTQD